MWNVPTAKQLAKIPALYATESIPLASRLVFMHFFMGSYDFYAVEYDPKNEVFFGFVNLNGNGEWGYVSLKEMKDLHVQGMEMDREIRWKVIPAGEIPGIKEMGGV